MNIDIYTDGACSGNPGLGGWGAVIIPNSQHPIYINGGKLNTTNNQMELIATIKALQYFNNTKVISLFTDSKYVKNGIELWIKKWKKNNWQTSTKKPVKNKDLWLELDKQTQRHKVNWKWIKGHTGKKYNELADTLAKKFIEENR